MPKAKPSAHPYAIGDLVAGKYRLDRLLGEGGMGAVWAAENLALGSPVAIKVIRGESDRESLSLRLHQEARAAARLGHPGIVRVFDIGQTDQGDPFIVMELLEGESLAEKLAREGRLTAIEAVQALLPIADALRAAHVKGIVHRDIKPDNVFLAAHGEVIQPKLVDFGIAKLEQLQGGSQLTQLGVVVGSPDYMSPEQARGEESVDYRADIWSFCVVLYEAVSGRVPFDGPNYNALLRAIVEDRPPSLRELNSADTKLSTIIETGMSKDRNERWRSMQDLGTALASWLILNGVLEDMAGTSLDAKWISRRSDSAGRQSRSSLGSIPDGMFSPASGIAVTMPAPAILSSTPPTIEQPKLPLRWSRRTLVLASAGSVLALAGAAALLGGSDDPPAAASPPTPEVAAAPEAQPEPTLVPARPKATAQADAPAASASSGPARAEPSAGPTAAAGTPPRAPPRARKPASRSKTERAAPRRSEPKPASDSDLIRPY